MQVMNRISNRIGYLIIAIVHVITLISESEDGI